MPEQLNLEGQWELSEKSYPSMYQNATEGKFIFFDNEPSDSSEFQKLEPGLNPSITDIVEAMDAPIQKRHNNSESCIKVKVSRRYQKTEIYLANERSGPAFFGTDLGQIFRKTVVHEFGLMFREKGPRKPDFAYDIICIHSLTLYTDLIEYNTVSDTKTPLMRRFFLFQRLRWETS